MVAEWYCEIAGREVGPLSPQQLKAMAEKGRILPNDGVRRGAQGEWILAGRINGLLPRSVSPPPVAAGSSDPIDEQPRNGPQPPPAPPPVVRPKAAEVPDVGSIRIVADPPQTNRDTVLPRVKRQRDQQAKMVGVLLGSILILAAAAIYMSIGGDGGKHGLGKLADRAVPTAPKDPRKRGPKKPVYQSPETLEKLEGVISFDEPVEKKRKSIAEILGMEAEKSNDRPEEQDAERPIENRADAPIKKQTESPAEEPDVKPNNKNPLLDHEWIDASTSAAVVGFISVRIVSAEVVPSLDGAAGSSPRTIITVELRNGGARDVDFKGWTRGGVARGAKLFDDAGNVYRPKALGRAPLPGRGPPMSIAAGRAAREVLAFESPPDEAEYVLIELPAAAFGMDAIVRLKIPAEMISEQPPEEQPRRPQPGTPEFDFGLPEVDETIQ
ncbi:MAG: DUF4339 domain-containing protein [Planctomycetes bacterium]|nr:DUF4339 domain-containing protein [Planctomycetota bacterium]MCG2684719.1 DUF4339 domain-containing protein [Planctomycetales bacterium]